MLKEKTQTVVVNLAGKSTIIAISEPKMKDLIGLDLINDINGSMGILVERLTPLTKKQVENLSMKDFFECSYKIGKYFEEFNKKHD